MDKVKGNPRYHFIGIGGIGMSGLASALLKLGSSVSGSDTASNAVVEKLIQQGATFYEGHSAEWIQPEDEIIFNSSITPDNPEMIAAKKYQCRLRHRSDLLAEFIKAKKGLTVAGTHGKTTTSSLLAFVLQSAGLNPSYFIGGVIPQLGTNADVGSGDFLVAEADESDGTFLKYTSQGAIVTNIGLDHMGYFRSEENLIDHFKQFFFQVQNPKLCFWCGDDQRLLKIKPAGFSYGFGYGNDLRITGCIQKGWVTRFNCQFQGLNYDDLEIPLQGRHNALNAAAVFGLALQLGLCEIQIRESFKNFQGVCRRVEQKGIINDILLLDDYAHHPTEIKTTLEGIRNAVGKRRLIVVFQPHRYSRVKDCLGTFCSVFDACDRLIVTEIYHASEEYIPGITHDVILKELDPLTSEHIPRDRLVACLSKILKPQDVLVTLGAGNITHLSAELKEELKRVRV